MEYSPDDAIRLLASIFYRDASCVHIKRSHIVFTAKLKDIHDERTFNAFVYGIDTTVYTSVFILYCSAATTAIVRKQTYNVPEPYRRTLQ